jgi:hypothetical protein
MLSIKSHHTIHLFKLTTFTFKLLMIFKYVFFFIIIIYSINCLLQVITYSRFGPNSLQWASKDRTPQSPEGYILPVRYDTSLTSGTSMKSLDSRFFSSGLWYKETSIFGMGRELLRFLGCC